MRLTVLQQQTKTLQAERPDTGTYVSQRLESVKHFLWHGNAEEALERLGDLIMELSLIQARSAAASQEARRQRSCEELLSVLYAGLPPSLSN